MARKVGLSQQAIDDIAALHDQAEQLGCAHRSGVRAIAIWTALHERPLPPDESDGVFGEIRYQTKHPPRHFVCIASRHPLAVQFAVSEETTDIANEPIVAVTILKVRLMS